MPPAHKGGTPLREQPSPAESRRIIGLTGNIACGKSLVLSILRELGADTLDADTLAHQAIRRGGPAYEAVIRRFGETIRRPDGDIDRTALGKVVFADRVALRELEGIIHPHVRPEIRRRIAEARGTFVVDAIKLLESGIAELCDEVWVVTCRKEQQVTRLISRNGYTEEEALRRVEAQRPVEEKIAAADVVINNEGSVERTRTQVERAYWRRGEGRPHP